MEEMIYGVNLTNSLQTSKVTANRRVLLKTLTLNKSSPAADSQNYLKLHITRDPSCQILDFNNQILIPMIPLQKLFKRAYISNNILSSKKKWGQLHITIMISLVDLIMNKSISHLIKIMILDLVGTMIPSIKQNTIIPKPSLITNLLKKLNKRKIKRKSSASLLNFMS